MRVINEVLPKVFYRLLGLPFVVLWAAFITFAGMMFPFILIMGFSFLGLISFLPIFVLRQGGVEINFIDPFFSEVEESCGTFLAYTVGISLPIWSVPAITWLWLYKGKVYNPEI